MPEAPVVAAVSGRWSVAKRDHARHLGVAGMHLLDRDHVDEAGAAARHLPDAHDARYASGLKLVPQ